MIKMTYKQLTSMEFRLAFQKLRNLQLPTKLAYDVKKLTDQIERILPQINASARTDLLEVYCEKGHDGRIVSVPEDPNRYKIQESKKEEYAKAEEDFGKREAMIERNPIDLASLEGQRFSASEIAALEPIFVPEVQPQAAESGGTAVTPESKVTAIR